jgi:outer membrane protein insertion porin family
LNQLSYFEPLKPEESTERKLNEQDGTVDLTLKVKEKGKNSIGLSGGVSGIEGPFIGLNYSTNNLFGLGETVSVGANIGSLQRTIQLGFTEPYAFDRPLQLGFTVYGSKYNYNEAKQESIAINQSLNLPQNELDLLQNFTQSSTGFTLSATYPIRRSFKRVGITYNYDDTSIQTFSTASQQYFDLLSFRGISGPNALSGIHTSKITPNFSSNTIDYPLRPHKGQSFYAAMDFAGLGGNVKSLRPIIEYKRFQPMKLFKPLKFKDSGSGKQTLGFRLQGSFLTGYGGLAAPPFQRFFMGGENDVRGFDARSITPYTFITTTTNVTLTTGSAGGLPVPVDPNNPALRGSVNIPLAIQQLVFTGGDTTIVSNIEYRIPIAGPVAIAIFNDIGFDGVLRSSQLKLSQTQIDTLNSTQFFCPSFATNAYVCNGETLQSLGPRYNINPQLSIIPGTNWQPRDSTGLELQVMMPIINAPFRLYYAYNPLRINQIVAPPPTITRSLFPPGDAGEYTYRQVIQTLMSPYIIREPRKTFRFTVSTTF